MPDEIRPLAAYTVAEVAELVRCDRRVVYRAIDAGELRSWIPSGCAKGRRVLGQWALDWMEGRAARF